MKNDGKNARGIVAMVSLEPRRMLAGNVTVVWSDDGSFDGLLTITGDNKSNQFIVSVEDVTTITGLNGTKINGGSSAAFDFFPNLAIDTGNGDDEVEVVGLFSALSARTGNGNDIVKITESDFVATFAFDQFEIDTGNGNDYVLLESLTCFECDLHIRMGNGNDTVKLEGTILMQGIFADAGTGTIDMGRGSDTIDATLFVAYIAPDPLVVIGNETVLT
jgi:hypothetical protein